MNFSITIYGKPLDEDLYTIDLENKTFSTEANNLVLDFTGVYHWTFNTGGACIFSTSSNCTFKTTGRFCTFNTGNDCTFNTGRFCTFNTGYTCTFKTGKLCTFLIYNINTCKFKSYDDISTILDRQDNKHYILTKELIDILKITNN